MGEEIRPRGRGDRTPGREQTGPRERGGLTGGCTELREEKRKTEWSGTGGGQKGLRARPRHWHLRPGGRGPLAFLGQRLRGREITFHGCGGGGVRGGKPRKAGPPRSAACRFSLDPYLGRGRGARHCSRSLSLGPRGSPGRPGGSRRDACGFPARPRSPPQWLPAGVGPSRRVGCSVVQVSGRVAWPHTCAQARLWLSGMTRLWALTCTVLRGTGRYFSRSESTERVDWSGWLTLLESGELCSKMTAHSSHIPSCSSRRAVSLSECSRFHASDALAVALACASPRGTVPGGFPPADFLCSFSSCAHFLGRLCIFFREVSVQVFCP